MLLLPIYQIKNSNFGVKWSNIRKNIHNAFLHDFSYVTYELMFWKFINFGTYKLYQMWGEIKGDKAVIVDIKLGQNLIFDTNSSRELLSP